MLRSSEAGTGEGVKPTINFVTNHTYVLAAIALDSEIRMREIAQKIGITERAVQRIVEELISAEFLISHKSGRRNAYKIQQSKQISGLFDCALGDLLGLCKRE